MAREFIIVLPLEEIPRGASFNHSLPLHCTLMPWFTLGKKLSPAALESELQRFATSLGKESLKLKATGTAMFGSERDVPCYVIRPNPDLLKLHTRIFAFLAKKESLPSKLTWIGAGYRPHVSKRDDQLFLPRTSYYFRHLCLIERKAGEKIVRSSIAFT